MNIVKKIITLLAIQIMLTSCGGESDSGASGGSPEEEEEEESIKVTEDIKGAEGANKNLSNNGNQGNQNNIIKKEKEDLKKIQEELNKLTIDAKYKKIQEKLDQAIKTLKEASEKAAEAVTEPENNENMELHEIREKSEKRKEKAEETLKKLSQATKVLQETETALKSAKTELDDAQKKIKEESDKLLSASNKIKNAEEFKEVKEILKQKEKETDNTKQQLQKIQEELKAQKQQKETIENKLDAKRESIYLSIDDAIEQASELAFEQIKNIHSKTNYKILGLRSFNDTREAVDETVDLLKDTEIIANKIKEYTRSFTIKDIIEKKINSVKVLTEQILKDNAIKKLIQDIKLNQNINQDHNEKSKYVIKLTKELISIKEECSYCKQIMDDIEEIAEKYTTTTDETNEAIDTQQETIQDIINRKTEMKEEEIKETILFYVQYNVLNKLIFSEMKDEEIVAILINAAIKNKQVYKENQSEREFINKYIGDDIPKLKETLLIIFNITDNHHDSIILYLTSFFASKMYCIEKNISTNGKTKEEIQKNKEKLINEMIENTSDDINQETKDIRLKIHNEINTIFNKCNIGWSFSTNQDAKKDILFLQILETYNEELLEEINTTLISEIAEVESADSDLELIEVWIMEGEEKLETLGYTFKELEILEAKDVKPKEKEEEIKKDFNEQFKEGNTLFKKIKEILDKAEKQYNQAEKEYNETQKKLEKVESLKKSRDEIRLTTIKRNKKTNKKISKHVEEMMKTAEDMLKDFREKLENTKSNKESIKKQISKLNKKFELKKSAWEEELQKMQGIDQNTTKTEIDSLEKEEEEKKEEGKEKKESLMSKLKNFIKKTF